MALLFNNAITTTSLPTVIESPSKYAFNGHVYNKTNMNPIPLKFFTALTTPNNVPIFKRTVGTHPYWTHNKQTNNMEIDIDDPNTFYILINDNNAQSLNKITSNADGSYTVTSYNMLITSGDAPFRATIIDQDSMYLYVLKNPYGSGYISLFKVQKSTMTATRVDFFGSSYKAKLMYKDANTIYLCITTSANGVTTHIYKVNKADLTLTDSLALTKDYTLQALNSDKVIYESTSTSSVYYLFNVNATVAEMKKITVDNTNGSINSITITCYEVVNGVEKQVILQNTFTSDDCWETIAFQANGNKYIGVFYTCSNINLTGRSTGFFVFKVMPDGRLSLIQRQVYPYAIVGFLEFNNNLNLALMTRTSIRNIAWDVNSEKYILVNEISNGNLITLIGADENNNLWSYTDSKSVSVHSQYSPSNISAEFELDNYEFKGVPIGSFINFYAKNFYGNFVTCAAEITLEGPCRFTDNGSQVITKSTSSTGKLSIPIEVTDNGVLRVGIRLLQS